MSIHMSQHRWKEVAATYVAMFGRRFVRSMNSLTTLRGFSVDLRCQNKKQRYFMYVSTYILYIYNIYIYNIYISIYVTLHARFLCINKISHMHVYVHTQVHVHIFMYTHILIHAHTHTNIHIHVHIHTYIHTYIYIYSYKHTHIHACMHTYTEPHIYIYMWCVYP